MEFCGRDAAHRPDRCRRLYEQHQRLPPERRPAESPFITFNDYWNALARFIVRYNSTAHRRATLGGQPIAPLDEYRRLYTTCYDIKPETLVLLLMRAEKRRIRKNGVQCFQSHWFYYHEALAEFKGADVEVRYSDCDYNRVWVLLPNRQLCEAVLITPTSILNPDKQTLKRVSEARAHERKLIRESNLLHASNMRSETAEERTARELQATEPKASETEPQNSQARVYQLTRMERPKLRQVISSHTVTTAEVTSVEADFSILQPVPQSVQVRGFDYEEEEASETEA